MCMYDGDSDGWVTVLSQRIITVTPTKCVDCGRRIPRGEIHHRVEWADDTDGWFAGYANETPDSLDITEAVPAHVRRISSIQCAHCAEAARWLDVVCGGFVFDGVGADLESHWDHDWLYCTLGLGRLIVAHRRDWRAREIPVDVLRAGGWDVSKIPAVLVPVAAVRRWVDDALAEHERRQLSHGRAAA